MDLKAVTISNFRSIRGSVTVPLDAPIVLIHGLNGAGKTSVLAAIELALTGQFAGVVPDQPGVLVHRGSKRATIQLDTTDGTTMGELAVSGLDLTPMLGAAEARFYAERCYLTQARLGRLLEIYQSAEGQKDTPLTRFIKDLLRLNRLDALVDGLHAVGDVRNLRKLAPQYGEVERALNRGRDRVQELRRSLQALTTERQALMRLMKTNADNLGVAAHDTGIDVGLAQWQGVLADDGTIEDELTILTGARRELASGLRRLQRQALPNSADALMEAATAAATARQLADEWHRGTGAALEEVIEGLRALLPDLPSAASSGPTEAFSIAINRASIELDRCIKSLSTDDAQRISIESLGERIAQIQARLADIDTQIEGVGSGGDLESLIRALSELVVHVRGDDCPVCGRDFGEVSKQPLRAALTGRIGSLSESAAHLQSLIQARTESSSDLRATRDRYTMTLTGLLREPEKLSLQRRSAALSQSLARLREMRSRVDEGSGLLRAATATSTDFARATEANRAAAEVDVVVSDIADSIGVSISEAESAQQKAETVRGIVDARIGALEARARLFTQTRALASQLSMVHASVQDGTTALSVEVRRVDSLTEALSAAAKRREAARQVRAKAVSARTSIVQAVFNDSLNKLWRELFIRLAPSEPYVPAFRLPDATGTGVIAALHTVHRGGEAAGLPQVMLSAGNLNTAALTLFFALHLSAAPILPWIVLDDPVQSMDELHVAQLAALLRTISRQHDRQVILAVHERPLFDYLTLELSPGRPKDRLITVEIGRERGGDTIIRPTYRTYEEDRAVPAA